MLRASYLKSRKCTHTVRRKPQPWMVANSLISLRAAEIPGILDRWHMKCLTISQPHNDTHPLPFAWVSKFPGQHTLANGVIMIEGGRKGWRWVGGTLRPNDFLKITTLSRLLLGPSLLRESSRDWGMGGGGD